jgi:hypothetical protein
VCCPPPAQLLPRSRDLATHPERITRGDGKLRRLLGIVTPGCLNLRSHVLLLAESANVRTDALVYASIVPVSTPHAEVRQATLRA